ncbi:MAG: hypothetical protein ACOY32_02000 [Thermodesulfobacteriota bacterium]
MVNEALQILLGISLMLLIRIPLWRRFHDKYRHGGILHLADIYRKTAKLLANFDFYPSWKKHPLQVSEYTAFIKLLGFSFRWLPLSMMSAAFFIQFLLTVIMTVTLSSLIPQPLYLLPFVAASCCIAPLYLSLTVMPDIFLMTAISTALGLMQAQQFFPPVVFSVLLGLLGWLAIRIKTSGFILAISICATLPFLHLGALPSLLSLGLIACPFLIDIRHQQENMVVNILLRQKKYFGYSLADEKQSTLPDNIVTRSIIRRLVDMIKLFATGAATALAPWQRFSFYRSNGIIYPLGLAGMVILPCLSREIAGQPLYLFSCFYLFFFILFHSQLRRFFHFASRAGGTLYPVWLLWAGLLLSQMGETGLLIMAFSFTMEGRRSFSLLFRQPASVYFEPPLSPAKKNRRTIVTLRRMIKPQDLLMLTYQDLNSFGIALQSWQIPIELEKTSTLTMCKYIDYYRHDQRYRRIFLILPPGKELFLDKNLRPHFIEEEPLASRVALLKTPANLHGYRIFEVLPPSRFVDLSPYEALTPDQLKHMRIEFGENDDMQASLTELPAGRPCQPLARS